jgi:hypothetical protein
MNTAPESVSNSSIVVKHSPYQPNVKGLSAAAAAHTGRERKMLLSHPMHSFGIIKPFNLLAMPPIVAWAIKLKSMGLFA